MSTNKKQHLLFLNTLTNGKTLTMFMKLVNEINGEEIHTDCEYGSGSIVM